MNEFDDRKATDLDHFGGQPSVGDGHSDIRSRAPIDQGSLLLDELYRLLGTWDEVASHLGVHRLTVRRWRRQGMTPKNIEQAKAAMTLANKRDEVKADDYVIHGEDNEPMPIGPLKQLVATAVQVRKVGLTHRANAIDEAIIAMSNELDDHYGHPSLAGAKLKAIKAASQTGLGKLREAIATYEEAAQEMHDADELGEEYRYALSVLFLQIKHAWAERDAAGSDLYIVLGRAKQFIEQQPPKEASGAARRQRYGIGLSVFALLPPGKTAFLKWARMMMNDSDAYAGQAEAYDAIFEEVAGNRDGRFAGVVEGGWLSSLRRG